MNIAIDGPAGAGKSTIARLAAEKLNYIYVDTGAMYRAIALYILENHIDLLNEKALKGALDLIQVRIEYLDKVQQVFLNDENVSGKIRTEEVGNMASKASAQKPVRIKLLDLQREIAANNNVIMDGRDIGTNVLPNAEIKIYLTASVDVRAKRRYDELINRGVAADLSKIKDDISARDFQDMNRDIAPLKQASDAVYLDTSDKNIDEVVSIIIELNDKKMEKL